MRHRIRSKMGSVPSLLLVFCAAPLAFVGCVDRLFYYPDSMTYLTPDSLGVPVQEVRFLSEDGTSLHGWFLPGKNVVRGTVVHFHGNAQNLSSHVGFVSWLPEYGFNVFAFDYRGYGKSKGKPNRGGLVKDAKAALRYIRSRPDLDASQLFVLAQSLGAAPALQALKELGTEGVQAVAVEAAFDSYREIVKDKAQAIPLVSLFSKPLSWLLIGDRWSPSRAIRAVAPVPLVLIHGTADAVIPYAHAERLFKAASEPKELWPIEGGLHTEAFTTYGAVYREKLVRFFKGALMRPQG